MNAASDECGSYRRTNEQRRQTGWRTLHLLGIDRRCAPLDASEPGHFVLEEASAEVVASLETFMSA